VPHFVPNDETILGAAITSAADASDRRNELHAFALFVYIVYT